MEVIDSAIHVVQALWDKNASTEEWVFTRRQKECVQQD